MNYYSHHQNIINTVLSIILVALFFIWTEVDIDSLHKLSREDGAIENLSAILFGLSSLCFLIFAYRSNYLKEKTGFRYFIPLSWAFLMFVFMGEDISWGQRIFNIQTPELLSEINRQNEINIHNIEVVDTFMGGKYRYLSIMMLTTGLILPILALSEAGKKAIQWFAFPVSPLCYMPLFVGAYLFGKYYAPLMIRDAAEVREFLMSVAMFAFAMHGALSPCTLFRVCTSQNRQ